MSIQLHADLRSRGYLMDIGCVSKLTGLPTSTLRYYEERGLIKSVGRNGLRRIFSEGVIETLSLISLGRNAGLSLDEIGAMFLSGELQVDRDLLLSRADDIDQKILELIAIRDGLRHVAACKAPTHMECSKFRKLLKIASKKENRSKHKL